MKNTSLLPIELLQSIIGSMQEAESLEQNANRRSENRTRIMARGTLSLPAGDRPAPAMTAAIRDISSHGVGVVIPRAIPSGARFVLEVSSPFHAEPISVVCTALHCHPLGGLLHAVGAVFTSTSAASGGRISGEGGQNDLSVTVQRLRQALEAEPMPGRCLL